MRLVLPWPEKALWQNRRPHWREKRRATAAYRKVAWAVAREAGVKKDPNAVLRFSFHPPNRIRRDLHNMPATQKPAIDGIADAMRCDDQNFRCKWPHAFSEAVEGGCVIVEIGGQG